MEQLITQVLAFDQQGDLSVLTNLLKNSEALLSTPANQPALLPALAQLQPHVHSLASLHILSALLKGNYLTTTPQAIPEFIDYTTGFLGVCSGEQIRTAPDVFCMVCRKYKEHVMSTGNPRRGIAALRAALRTLQGGDSELLTPVHADLFQLCLLAKIYNAASEVLQDDVYNVDPARSAMTPTDLFLYCYYGGMLLLGLKELPRALELFLTAVTAPALVANAVVLACYKKYLLTSLVHLGHVAPLPKFTSGRVRQVLEGEAKPYLELASAYASHSQDRLRRALEQHGQAFAADNNVGLVRQVAASLTKRNIQRLTQTYLSLSLQDIAGQVGLASAEEVELHLLRMVGAGEIHAVISGTMVRFLELEGAEQYNSAAMVGRMDACMQRCMRLNGKLAEANEAVSTDRAYVSKASAKERNRFDAGGGAGSGLEDFGGGSSQGLYQPAL